jgi:Flp pilus assembly protein TadD
VEPRRAAGAGAAPAARSVPAPAARRGAGPPRAGAWRDRLTHPATAGAVATMLLHLQSLANGFVRDDVPLFVANPLVRESGHLGQLLSSDFLAGGGFTSGLWRPLPMLMFWIEVRLGGGDPFLFHAVNLVLAALAAGLVGLLLTQAGLARLPALLATLWFASLPAHVEPVAWISGRTDLLSGMLALLALWLDRRARAAGRAWPGIAAPAALAGALLSKESAAAWPLVILVAEWVRTRRVPASGGEIARWLAPYAAVTGAWLIAHAAIAGPVALPPYVDAALAARRHAAGWRILPAYLSFLWPGFPHSADSAVPLPGTPAEWQTIVAATFTGIAFALAGIAALARRRIAVPCTMVLAPLLPGIALALARGFLAHGERMVYLASAGVACGIGEALAVAWARGSAARTIAGTAFGLLAAAGAVVTLTLQPLWRNDEIVFRTMTERQPGNPAGWVGLGETWMRDGRMEEAERALAHAGALDPRLPSVPLARMELFYRARDWDRVLEEAGRALALDSTLYAAHLTRASALVALGRAGEAGPDLETLLRDRPGDPSALTISGQRYLALGQPALAVAPLAAAARVAPDPELLAALGGAQAAVGDLAAARQSLERAVALDPAAHATWRRLAAVCAALGDSAAARTAFERAQP